MLTAIILVLTSQQLKPLQEANLALDSKRSVLKSVLVTSDQDEVIENSYDSSVKEIVVDSEGNVKEGVDVADVDLKREVAKDASERQLPLYVFTEEDGSNSYIVPMRGVGLWGPVWGYVALGEDFNTIKGAFFDHKGETPGLGAEITEPFFQVQFQGKKILDDNGDFASINVLKSTMKSSVDSDNRVDAISGGTITSNGVDDMIENCVAPYLTYFNKLKSN